MYELTKEQLIRYSRQLLILGFGLCEQEKLFNSKTLIVGAGALACSNMLYLTAAGVGNIGIIDNDKVKLENLHRQVVYTEEDIGKFKVAAAKERLIKLNKDVKIKTFNKRLDKNNALKIMKDYDFIIDCTDNISTRLTINKFAYKLKKTWFYAAVYAMEGQASVIIPGKTPCYRCFFEEKPDEENVPDCLSGGIIGVIPALIGSIQATEVIKTIIGKPLSLAGKLLIYQAMKMKFDIVDVKKRKNCPVCGEK